MRHIATAILIIAILVGIGVFTFLAWQQQKPEPAPVEQMGQDISPRRQAIGTSVEGREIEAYSFGRGGTHLVFVGGIHGGYEWNTVLLAYEFLDYFNANPQAIPDNIAVTLIPSANPDGLYEITGKEGRFVAADIPNTDTSSGRFNANGVDLNRNFDCKWLPQSMWRNTVVRAGTEPFSEPEAKALRNFILEHKPDAVVFWHSQANAVYASDCEDGISRETLDIMEAYAEAADYQAVESFDAYEVTGAAEGWVASLGIPALTVELQTHETIEWKQNAAGVNALFAYYATKP